MAIAFVQSKSATVSFATSVGVAFTSNNTAGNLLICGEGSDSATVPTVSDTKNGAWAANNLTRIASGVRASVFSFPNCGAGANTVTVSWGATDAAGTIEIAEYSGMATSTPLDKTAGGDGFGTAALTAATTTTAQADELLIGVACRESTTSPPTYTAGTSYTEREDPGTDPRPGYLEDRIVSATGTYTASATLLGGSENWTIVIATYKAASAGATTWGPLLGLGNNRLVVTT